MMVNILKSSEYVMKNMPSSLFRKTNEKEETIGDSNALFEKQLRITIVSSNLAPLSPIVTDAHCSTIDVHRWLCTTGRAGFETPTGEFSMPEKKGDERKDWCSLNGYKVRYASRVTDGVYIHLVQYREEKDDAVRRASLARLGHRGSLGSVIVEYAHAKWIRGTLKSRSRPRRRARQPSTSSKRSISPLRSR